MGSAFQIPVGIDPNNDPALGDSAVHFEQDSDFVVLWREFSDVNARRYSADAIPFDDPVPINSFPADVFVEEVDVAGRGNDGGALATWAATVSPGDDIDETAILGRFLDADSEPVGPDIQVNTTTPGPQYQPTVAFRPNGETLVAWRDAWPLEQEIRGRQLLPDGRPLGPDRLLAQSVPGGARPRAAADGEGNYLIVWEDQDAILGAFLPTLIFADGFESGGTAAWSQAVP